VVPPSEQTARVAARLDGVVALDLEVVAAEELLDGVRALRLRGELLGFSPWPGQDVMVSVPPGSPSARFRRYTVRRWDPDDGTLELWVTTATGGPGAGWATSATPGDRVDAAGPRGKIALDATADAHLFVVDESGLAAWCAMAEGAPRGARLHALLVLEHALGATTAIEPLVAVGVSATSEVVARTAVPAAIERVLGTVDAATTAAYAFGELGLTREVAASLASLGVAPARTAVKPYWRDDRANEANGEPDRGSE
jgi:NADPH-dependent ferric siderophore reductase